MSELTVKINVEIDKIKGQAITKEVLAKEPRLPESTAKAFNKVIEAMKKWLKEYKIDAKVVSMVTTGD